MRSSESNHSEISETSEKFEFSRDPDSMLGQFEETIRKTLARLEDKNLTHAQKKKVIRLMCLKNGQNLGIAPEQIQSSAMYFFRLLYENPDETHVLWARLHDLFIKLQNENPEEKENQDKIIKDIEELFAMNKGGLTFFWRLVHAVCRGDFDIQKQEINSESIYFITIPDAKTSKERNTNQGRRIISHLIKDKLQAGLIEKPIMQPTESIQIFQEEDQTYLKKIIVFLQQDADLLVLSSEWKKMITRYFDDVAGFLKKSIQEMTPKVGKSDKRKKVCVEYIDTILEGYLNNLRQYCLEMSDAQYENPFASDALLEPGMIRLLKDGTDEPSLEVIVQRWKRLMKDLQRVVADNATRLHIPIMRIGTGVDGIETDVDGLNPDEFGSRPTSGKSVTMFFHPALSGEIPIVSPITPPPNVPQIRADSSASLKSTVLGIGDQDWSTTQRDAIPMPEVQDPASRAKDSLLEWAEEGDYPSDQRQSIKAKDPLNHTILGIAAIDDDLMKRTDPGVMAIARVQQSPAKERGVDPLGATLAAAKPNLYKKQSEKARIQKIDYKEFINSLPRHEIAGFEEYLKNLISQEFAELKKQILTGALDLPNQTETFLLNRIQTAIYRRFVHTDNLRIFFITECCRMYNGLKSDEANSDQTIQAIKKYIYGTYTVLFSIINHELAEPDELKQFADTYGFPDKKKINAFTNPPALTKYPRLMERLSADDPVLTEIYNYIFDASQKLTNFEYFLATLIKYAEGGRNGTAEIAFYWQDLTRKHKSIKAIIENLRAKHAGGFMKRLFANRQSKKEVNEYFRALSDHIDLLWDEGIEPSVRVYGKLILGRNRKQSQEEKE